VQGDLAAREVESALACLNASGMVDVIVLARGGGSLEDLAAFNSERVARAIVASRVPVVSAIGHETDFTIADFAADLRAPTPSAAAELITTAQHRIAEHVAAQSYRLDRAVNFQLLQARQRFSRIRAERAESRMAASLRRHDQRLDDVTFRMDAALSSGLRHMQNRVADLAAAVLRHDPRQRLAHARQHFAAGSTRLDRSFDRIMQARTARLGALHARLNSLSPLGVLDRGYALVLDEHGTLVRSTSQVTAGKTVVTRLSDGAFTSRVENASPQNKTKKRDQ
jgi:exodeoxyribonuclease VII large subunit